MKKIYPNDPCPCGSGKKYKHCCGSSDKATSKNEDVEFDGNLLHRAGGFTEREVEALINDPQIVRGIYSELLKLQVLKGERGRSVFYDAYSNFKMRTIQQIQDGKFEIEAHKERVTYLKGLLPYIKEKKNRTHRQFHDIAYSALDVYEGYSSIMDLTETYAMFLLYMYSECHDTKSDLAETIDKSCVIDFVPVSKAIKTVLLDMLPFVGPRLVHFKTITDDNKYLDDNIVGVRDEDVRSRFFLACGKRDIRMAYKLIGDLRLIAPKEIDYYEGYVDYSDEHYEDALHYLKKIDKSSKYYLETKMLMLECYALIGNEEDFFTLINEKEAPLCFDFVRFAAQLLIKNTDALNKNIYQIVSEGEYSDAEDLGYRELVRRNSFEAMIEGANLLRKYEGYKKIYDALELKNDEKDSLRRDNQIIRFFLMGGDFFLIDNNNALSEGAMGEELITGIMNLIRDKYMGHDNIIPTCPEVTVDDQLFAFEALYNLGIYEGFYRQVSYALDWFKVFSYKPKAAALLKKAFVEGMVIKDNDKNLQNYVKETFYSNDDPKDNLLYVKMRTALSPACFVAYEAAEWQYKKSTEEDYGWKDAGMISLSFFRIVELMINEAIIFETAKQKGTIIKSLFSDISKQLSGSEKEKKKFRAKWSIINSTMQDLLKGKGPGLMLGSLEYYFKSIGSEYDDQDEIAKELRNTTKELLTEKGFELLIEKGYLEKALSSENRAKYRNPPAHCKYLPYGTARECREYTCDLLYLIYTSLRK